MADGNLNPIEQLEAEFDFDVYTKQEVDALLDEKADKSDTYTKTETDALLDDKADADAVYTKTETDTLLSAKADKSTTLAGYGITDAYTKTQTDTLLNGKADADSVYTKQEIDTKIPSSVGSATKPTYVNGGVITECTHELNKTVPANAVFTDTTYTAGNGLNLSGTSFSAKAGTNVTVDGNGINVNGSGIVASADSGLISGGTAYTELRPTLNGTWVKNAQTTATNLQKLEGGIEYLYGLLSHQYDQLKKYINGNYYDYQTDSDSKYVKTVPQGAMPYASLDSIGGKTLVFNQIVYNGNFADSNGWSITAGYTYSVTDNTLTVTKSVGTTAHLNVQNTSATATNPIVGHKYLVSCVLSTDSSAVSIRLLLGGVVGLEKPLSATPTHCYEIMTASNSTGNATVYCQNTRMSEGASIIAQNFMCFDLTLLYGAGNEPSTLAEFQQTFPAVWYAHNPGSLLSAGVTEVVSKKADTTEIATYPIPAEIQALEGYGWSAGSVYNYIDYEAKKFVKRVGSVVLNGTQTISLTNWRPLTNSVGWVYSSALANVKISGSASDKANIISAELPTITYGNIYDNDAPGIAVSTTTAYSFFVRVANTTLTNATAINNYLSANPITVYYEMDTPQETDISAYLTDDNLIEVEAGGTLTFENQNGDDYRIPVPSAETYMVDLQASL